MRLKQISNREKSVRLPLSLKESTHDLLTSFQAYYKAYFGEEVTDRVLVEQMLLAFMKSDKEFEKFLETGKVETGRNTGGNPAGGATAGGSGAAQAPANAN